jgi:hypothetical protein
MIDVNALIGPYPFRYVPHPEPEVLARVLEREGLSGAWVGHLPSAYYRDPSAGNAQLYTAVAQHAGVLRPVPAIRPDWPGWEDAVRTAAAAGAPAVRVYPNLWELGPHDPGLRALAVACGERKLAVLLTVRFEDLRQRHPLDRAGDLGGAAPGGVGHLVDLGAARGAPRQALPYDRQRAVRLWHAVAAAADADAAGESGAAPGRRGRRDPRRPRRAVRVNGRRGPGFARAAANCSLMTSHTCAKRGVR